MNIRSRFLHGLNVNDACMLTAVCMLLVLCMYALYFAFMHDALIGLCSDVVSVACFGVRVSVMFHLMLVHYTFSSVWVAEWPPFGK